MVNLIFGVYSGFRTLKTQNGGIYYFMKSLRKYNITCKVVIVCEETKIFDELVRFSKDTDFEIYSKCQFKNLKQLMYYRFLVYKKYLSEMTEPVDKILLSDINDVIFQDDPFCIEFAEDLYCALETNVLSDENNASSRLNMEWIALENQTPMRKKTSMLHQKQYPISKKINRMYQNPRYQNRYVVCAGTILGTYEGISRYLDFYENLQRAQLQPINDQGILNIYVYNHLLSKQLVELTNSKILTLDGIRFEDLTVDTEQNERCILNKKGEKYVILHQTNRCNLPFMLSLV